jgi:hypothetical protein
VPDNPLEAQAVQVASFGGCRLLAMPTSQTRTVMVNGEDRLAKHRERRTRRNRGVRAGHLGVFLRCRVRAWHICANACVFSVHHVVGRSRWAHHVASNCPRCDPAAGIRRSNRMVDPHTTLASARTASRCRPRGGRHDCVLNGCEEQLLAMTTRSQPARLTLAPFPVTALARGGEVAEGAAGRGRRPREGTER